MCVLWAAERHTCVSSLVFLIKQGKRNPHAILVQFLQTEEKKLNIKKSVAPEKAAIQYNMCIYVKLIIQLTSTEKQLIAL